MRIGFFVALMMLVSRAFAADPVHCRFSDATISALNDATASDGFSIEARPPSARYIKREHRSDTTAIRAWLEKQRSHGERLSPEAYRALRSLLLNPENHFGGLFAVMEPASYAVAFQARARTGYIILHDSLVTILWNGRLETALLDTKGTEALRRWRSAGR